MTWQPGHLLIRLRRSSLLAERDLALREIIPLISQVRLS